MQVQALVITAFAVAVVALSARMRTPMAEAFPADDEGRPGDMRAA